jgi:hypothetical protein
MLIIEANILVRAGNKVCSISIRCFPTTLTLKYEVNCSSAIVILFEPRPTISSSTLGTGICSQANLIILQLRLSKS